MAFRRRAPEPSHDPLADLDASTISPARRADAYAALDAARRYDAIVTRTPDGPIRDRLDALRPDVHAAVRSVFDAAHRTDMKVATLGDLDPDSVTRRMKEARRALAQAEDDGRDTTDLRAAVESLDRQLESVHAIWDAAERSAEELHRLQLRLAEVVALAGAVAADVPDRAIGRIGQVADELHGLRLALAEVSY
jgi:multidrug resistance efflux pump